MVSFGVYFEILRVLNTIYLNYTFYFKSPLLDLIKAHSFRHRCHSWPYSVCPYHVTLRSFFGDTARKVNQQTARNLRVGSLFLC